MQFALSCAQQPHVGRALSHLVFLARQSWHAVGARFRGKARGGPRTEYIRFLGLAIGITTPSETDGSLGGGDADASTPHKIPSPSLASRVGSIGLLFPPLRSFPLGS